MLSAVFLPMAFFGGSTGVIYRQFSVTIVSAMVLSVVVALVLTPALTATLLKRKPDVNKNGLARAQDRSRRSGSIRCSSAWWIATSNAVSRVVDRTVACSC